MQLWGEDYVGQQAHKPCSGEKIRKQGRGQSLNRVASFEFDWMMLVLVLCFLKDSNICYSPMVKKDFLVCPRPISILSPIYFPLLCDYLIFWTIVVFIYF